jgi:cytochrome c biogenesis protein CcmG/thiol:disulfide interchange protein DsbE
MTSGENDSETPKSRGVGRHAMALLPLLIFGGIALTAAKMLYEQDFHGKDVAAIPRHPPWHCRR